MGTVNDRIAGDNRKTYLKDAEAEDQKVKKVVDKYHSDVDKSIKAVA